MGNKKLSAIKADALVLGCAQTDDGPRILSDGIEPVDEKMAAVVAELGSQLGVSGAPDDVHKFAAPSGYQAKMVVLTGLGKADADGRFDPEVLRRAAGAAIRELGGSKSAALALPTDDDAALSAVAEGALLGAYAYNDYRSGEGAKAPVADIEVITPRQRSSRAKEALARADILANAVARTRDLTDAPANELNPLTFAAQAVAAVKGLPHVKATVLDEKALKSGGYVGLVAVGQGSATPPRLVTLDYKPPHAVGTVALVGKGITFDAGGISIKPSAGMQAMIMDMAGAAAVLETVVAAAQLGLPVRVLGYLCLAENMPGSNASRPGDIIKYRNGKTVEIINTDAEGRLVMADGIIDAVKAKADVIIDIATLTGAQILSLGHRTSGVMGAPDAMRDAVAYSAKQCGELFWPMPLPEELKAELKASTAADLANVNADKAAGMLFAAAFLREFVDGVPWAHLDIAGPAYNTKGPWGYTAKGGTGVGVRTLVTFLENFAAGGGTYEWATRQVMTPPSAVDDGESDAGKGSKTAK